MKPYIKHQSGLTINKNQYLNLKSLDNSDLQYTDRANSIYKIGNTTNNVYNGTINISMGSNIFLKGYSLVR